MESLSVLTLGPDICQLLGRENTRGLAREATVFGTGLTRGLINEAQKQGTAQLAVRGVSNACMSSGLAAIAEAHPLTAAAVGTGVTGAWLLHQLGSQSAERNKQLGNIGQSVWNDHSNKSLAAQANRISEVAGKDLFDNLFDIGTGAAGYKTGRPLAGAITDELPKIDMHSVFQEAGQWLSEMAREGLGHAAASQKPDESEIAYAEALRGSRRFTSYSKGSHSLAAK
jgi:hypothetical protein